MIKEETLIKARKINVFVMLSCAVVLVIQLLISIFLGTFMKNTWIYWSITTVTAIALVLSMVKLGVEARIAKEDVDNEYAYAIQGDIVGLTVLFMVIAIMLSMLLGLYTINKVDTLKTVNETSMLAPLSKVAIREAGPSNQTLTHNNVKIQLVLSSLIDLGVGIAIALYSKEMTDRYIKN